MATIRTDPPSPGRSAGVKEYVKRAFLYRWNMLLFAGGVVASILTPWPDALLPLVAAAEATYLGMLIASPKFRNAIDAAVYQEARQAPRSTSSGAPQRSIQEIIQTLTPDSWRRFEQVRGRCLEMRSIASGVRGRTGDQGEPGQDLSTPALDRLLWVFLRLLVSQEALQRFLQRTNGEEIKSRLAEAQKRLEKQKDGEERIIRTLQDSIAAQQLRLDNWERASNNAEFVRLELDRIEVGEGAIVDRERVKAA